MLVVGISTQDTTGLMVGDECVYGLLRTGHGIITVAGYVRDTSGFQHPRSGLSNVRTEKKRRLEGRGGTWTTAKRMYGWRDLAFDRHKW